MLNGPIAFLGGGAMAGAIVRCLLRAEAAEPAQIRVSDPQPASREAMAALGVLVTESNREACATARIIVLAVKPHVVASVLQEVGSDLGRDQLVVSIAAGVPVARIEGELPAGVPVIRVMPNLAIQVGEGAAAFCRGAHATDEHAAAVRSIFEAGGRCVEVSEAQMDAVTGLSGSGPAYAFLAIEALADGGVRMGLPREAALELAAQTVLGAARLLLETGEHPGVLRDRVTTPGGTTAAGLKALEEGGARAALARAVEAATRRSEELRRAGE